MSDAGFVGFAKSPKQREGVTLQEVQDILVLPVNRKVAAAALFSKLNAIEWLGEAPKWELSVGSKLAFVSGPLADQTLVVSESNLPRAITLMTESFGELRVTFSRRPASTQVELTFSRWSLPSENQLFDATVAKMLGALKSKLEIS